jgi:hypothetical protein
LLQIWVELLKFFGIIITIYLCVLIAVILLVMGFLGSDWLDTFLSFDFCGFWADFVAD